MTDVDPGEAVREATEGFYARGATDGLPVVPPTEPLVEQMLRGTDRPREDVVGTLGNRDDPLTVERLAINAVMAGCLPTHLPVLIAGAEAMAEPASMTKTFSVSTSGWAYHWLVNGPVREDLDVQCGSGAFGPGFRPNRAMARALGLAYKNTTRIQPGEKDMATLGNPFKFSLLAGENEAASPWAPYHVDAGFDADDSTITLTMPSSYVSWTPYRNTTEYVLEGLVEHLDSAMIGVETKTVWGLICPYSAEALAADGLDKADVAAWVAENSHVSRERWARGKYQDRYLDAIDPGPATRRQLPLIADPDNLELVVVGGPGTVNATVGPAYGEPITKRIAFPDGWEALVEEYREERDWVAAAAYYE